jgi:hypothetical protein
MNNKLKDLTTSSIGNLADNEYDIAQIMGGLYGDGFIGLKNAFTRE